MNKFLLSLVLTSFVSFIAEGKKTSLQDRIIQLEQIVSEQNSNRLNSADIVSQNQQMQQQIAELRGVIEEQNHQIQELKNKQKLLYVDIDSRLAELELGPINQQQKNENQTQSATNELQQPLTKVRSKEHEKSAATVVSEQPELSNYQEDYDIAFAHLRSGHFLESARAFETYIQRYPKNKLTANAYYWLGESYYVKRQYPQALAAFQTLIEKFPKSKKSSDANLKIGYCYYEMDDLAQATKHLNYVVDTYPNTSISRLAQNRLRQMRRDH